MRNVSPTYKIFLAIMLVAMIVAFGFWGWLFTRQARDAKTLPVLSEVQDFNLTERSERTITRDDLKDHIWVVDFIFTNCAGPCPMMSRRMSQLQTAFSYAKEVRLLSFSVDPERDTPEVLRAYADQFGADPEKWLFLTGDKSTILDIARSSLKVVVKSETESSPIVHSTYFILIDQHGKIRGYYNSSEPNSLSQLAIDVEKLRQEAGA